MVTLHCGGPLGAHDIKRQKSSVIRIVMSWRLEFHYDHAYYLLDAISVELDVYD